MAVAVTPFFAVGNWPIVVSYVIIAPVCGFPVENAGHSIVPGYPGQDSLIYCGIIDKVVRIRMMRATADIPPNFFTTGLPCF